MLPETMLEIGTFPVKQLKLGKATRYGGGSLESAGEIGSVHPWIFTLPGVSTPVVKSQRLGGEIAEELVEGGVDGCLLVAT